MKGIRALIGMIGLMMCAAVATQVDAKPGEVAIASNPASKTAVEADAPVVLDSVVVSGLQSGPDLWKVSKGEHVMWVLGTQSPLPKSMEWEPYRVQRLVSKSQAVLRPASANISVDAGFFGQLALIPSALKARKNPDGKTLKEILPPHLYARWLVQKEKYLGKDKGIESWRPIAAVGELYGEVLDRHRLKSSGMVWPVVEKAAKKNEVPVEYPQIKLKIKEPKKVLKAFAEEPLNDVPCFEFTLWQIEQDLPNMIARANAWAVGDLEALRQLPSAPANDVCEQAFLNSNVGKAQGFTDLPQQLENLWLTQAERSLGNHQQSFALLPMRQLLADDGLLRRLEQRGYTVTVPDAPKPESTKAGDAPATSEPAQ